MNDSIFSPQALNKAMLEAVEFIHAEGWDAGPTLFALVPTEMLVDTLDDADEQSPLTLVVQDNLPENLLPGSEALGDYISRLAWPAEIVGAVLAQEIMFTDAAVAGSEPRPARLFSGVLRGDAELTLLQLRPTEEELSERGPFAEDEIELRGGPGVAPGVIAALRYTLEADPEEI
ncbi:hypothetical protein N24_0909 [Corynebacterium suranareeae]|uniref:Uncharacterized protein n=1 Tax=Corynebacterium suranareeae TaxID=2506452 RepID=A0A160PQZ3_9CORY|nr:PPA1309 family protein [Corynebacterium suranareeae]BAU95171.1 hypothetical protein N24_0909 [Corynebacterium suranareeae]